MYRPSYHFLPEKNWMNDPNGVCWYRGKYHLFYQYNPDCDQWGNLHWGHAVSDDCVHWEHLPLALYPSVEMGEIHCFSGCASVDGERPLIYYTSVGEGSRDCKYGAQQWCAYSDKDMIHWTKYEKNPIMTAEIHDGLKVLDWRDPFVWKEDDAWYMVLGATVAEHGAALLYRSENQYDWEFVRVLLETENPGEVIWECPNYFGLGDEKVLVVSPAGPPAYYIGKETKEKEFIPESRGIMDHSGLDGFYAPNSFVDGRGRRIMIGWLTENGRGEIATDGWSGVQSVPRVLEMKDSILTMKPLPEFKSLRGKAETHQNLEVAGEWRPQMRGKALELCMTVDVAEEALDWEIDVFASEDGKERTAIRYNAREDELVADRSLSNASGRADQKSLSCKGTHSEGGKLSLHIFLDHSTLEIFINDREAISTRVYPDREDSDGIVFRTKAGGVMKVEMLEIYELGAG